ncbi:hypothetical protein PF005_g6283 [Phytophthora fragariae]|uniref:Uncharacterized protein n=2 Tax=Phytophthora TaxID=4783 RepID=A0A6A3LBS8_9STRA|nr:hypothetical protein PF003_g2481 [Phytophthora fragariae]KAE9017199.1 hypothetical protein PR002_g13455 [Phytophthora rubi]KAE8943794.1 hypothetical protein PF009_g6478 [Phytophthora fragariae]KAE9016896.1 hypothetical protein PF011_g6946 [Phytophthora fragariae]KAE9026709.1 hypothetical protein PR001_g12136 [Phytophthora rubi]
MACHINGCWLWRCTSMQRTMCCCVLPHRTTLNHGEAAQLTCNMLAASTCSVDASSGLIAASSGISQSSMLVQHTVQHCWTVWGFATSVKSS